jgi:hypothetical protein
MRTYTLFLFLVNVNIVTCGLVIAQQPANRFAGYPANYSQQQEDKSLQPWDDGLEQQQGASVGFSQQMDGIGGVTMQSYVGESGPRVSVGHSYGGSDTWLRGLESRVEADDFQTVFNWGGTAALLEGDDGIIAARALGGYALRHRDATEDSYQYSIDLYGARSIMNGQHWLKAGWFVDQQEEFGKTGPELGLLLFADHRTPLTADIAYGFGWGDDELVGDQLAQAADDDFQLRVGTILANRFRVGGTLQYLQYNPFGVENANEVWEGGAFVSFPALNGRVQVDCTTGEFGTSGMVSYVWMPGGGNIFRRVPAGVGCGSQVGCGSCCTCACVNRPEAWLSAPVSRRTGIRVRRHGNAGAGPLFGLNVVNVFLNLNIDAGVAGLNIGDADEAEIEIEVENETGLLRDLDVLGFLLFDGLNSGINIGRFSVQPGGGLALVNTDPNVGPGTVTQLVYETTFRDSSGQTLTLRAEFAPGSTNGATATSVTIL